MTFIVDEVGTTRERVPFPVTRQMPDPSGLSEAMFGTPPMRAILGSVNPAGFQYEFTVRVVLLLGVSPSLNVTVALMV